MLCLQASKDAAERVAGKTATAGALAELAALDPPNLNVQQLQVGGTPPLSLILDS
jgi:hypothetical protein